MGQAKLQRQENRCARPVSAHSPVTEPGAKRLYNLMVQANLQHDENRCAAKCPTVRAPMFLVRARGQSRTAMHSRFCNLLSQHSRVTLGLSGRRYRVPVLTVRS